MKTLKILCAALAAVTMAFTAQAAKTAKAVLTDSGATLKFVYDETNYGTKGTDWFSVAEAEAINPYSDHVPWYGCREDVTKAVFDSSFADYRPTQCGHWFYCFENLSAIEGIGNLDTSAATSLANMFCGCPSLTSLDVTGFDTANVTSMYGMFSRTSLTSLDLSGFDTSKVTDMGYMLYNCSSLVTIFTSDAFVTTAVMNSSSMFTLSTKLVGGAGTTFDKTKTDATYARIDGGPSSATPGYFTRKDRIAKAVVEDGGKTLRFVYDGKVPSGTKGTDWFEVPESVSGYVSPWKSVSESVTKVVFADSFKWFRPANCCHWFYDFAKLAVVEGIGNLNTSEAASLENMFSRCASLASIDISHFDMTKVTDWSYLFDGCDALKAVKLPASVTVIDVEAFKNCVALEAIDLSGITEIKRSAFGGCTNLKAVELPEGLVSVGSGAFSGCSSLKSVKLPASLKAGNVFALLTAFQSCDSLTAIEVASGNADLASVDGVLFNKDRTRLLVYPSGRAGDYSVPAGVKVLGTGAFSYSKVESVHLAASVETVEIMMLEGPFAMAMSLRAITVDAANPKFASVDGILYNKDKTELICCPFGFPGGVKIPSGVRTISDAAFMGCNIPYVTIPKSVTSIGLVAFLGGDVDEVEYIVKTIYVEPGDRDRIVNLLNIAHAVDMTMTSVVEGEPPTPVKTAKVVLTDSGKTLKFVYDYAIYPESTKGTAWFSVAEAEAIDPASGFMPWVGCAGSVTKVIFDSSFADCRPKHCGGWFCYFSSLASVEGLENLDVSKATSLARMFMGCSSLTTLDLAGFDTSCVTDMRGMFYGCSSLTTLDVSGFGTANVAYISGMFSGCSSLEAICVSDRFVTDQVSYSYSISMFEDCSKLKGGAGTAYDPAKTDKTYARIDGEDGLPGYFTRGAAKGVAGEYGKWTLPDLGIEPPAAGTVYSVKAYGLPSGLKLKYNAAKKDKKGKVIVKAKTDWWVEGVPTAALDAKTNPMYLAVTVGKETTWYPVLLTVTAQTVTDLGVTVVGTAINETGWLPGLADGGWSVSGLPKGLKYTANIVYNDPKKKSKGIKYAADTTYGKLSAAGLYTITAKKKVGGYYETKKFNVLVNPAGEFTTRNFTAYETFATMKDTSWKKVSGLPAGLKFTAKKYTVSGTITKPGTFAVTFTPKKGKAWTEMWNVAANPAGPALSFNTTGETSMSVLQGQKGKLNEITFPADGTVSVSGLPKGMKLVKNTDGTYSLGGVPSTAGTFFVTVKAAKNGQTVTQRVAVTVKTNPLAGTYYGYSVSKDGKYQYRTASLTIAASGKATLKYTEGSKTYTLTASAGEFIEFYSGKGSAYSFVQKANTKKKIPARAAGVELMLSDTMMVFGQWGVCTGTVLEDSAMILEGGFYKALSATTVNALRADPLTKFASKATYVLTSKADPAQVIYATYAYSSSTGKFTVKGKLPLGKAFSATVAATGFGLVELTLAPISAADADGTRYQLMLRPGGDGQAYVDGLTSSEFKIDSQRYDFGTGYTALPTTFAEAIANSFFDYLPVGVNYSSGEKEAFRIRASGTKYFQVSFDDGATWGAKTKYTYDKERGLITLSFTQGKTKYALDLLYAQPGLLYGQMKRQSNPVYNKKTKKTTYTTEYGKVLAEPAT